jgi:hypothetical protein
MWEYLRNCQDGDKGEESCILPPYLSFFSNALLCFQSPIKTLEKDTTTVTQLFHIMSTLKGKLEQRKKDKYVGETTEAYLMKLSSTKTRKIEKYPLSFYTNAIAYLIKWFKFNDENYLKHIECLSFSAEIEYEELQKTVALLRFQPMVIMDDLCEESTTVQPCIANLMQMTGFKDMNVGEKWVKVCSHQEVPLPNLIKIVSFVMSIPVSNAYVERLFSHDVLLA